MLFARKPMNNNRMFDGFVVYFVRSMYEKNAFTFCVGAVILLGSTGEGKKCAANTGNRQ